VAKRGGRKEKERGRRVETAAGVFTRGIDHNNTAEEKGGEKKKKTPMQRSRLVARDAREHVAGESR